MAVTLPGRRDRPLRACGCGWRGVRLATAGRTGEAFSAAVDGARLVAVDVATEDISAEASQLGRDAVAALGSALGALGGRARWTPAPPASRPTSCRPTWLCRAASAAAADAMVAGPPMRVRVEPMSAADIPAVHDIERASFPVPWPAYAFRQELETNRLARYLVVARGDRTVAYGGLWLMVDEAHVTTFAVLPDVARRRGGRPARAGADGACRPRWGPACSRWRSASATPRRARCTSASASGRWASDRATTPTTARTP